MARLRDIAKLIRSKNAGPFQLTLDIMFPNARSYRHVVEAGGAVFAAQGIRSGHGRGR